MAVLMALLAAPLCAADEGKTADERAGKCKVLFPIVTGIHPEYKNKDRIKTLERLKVGQRITDHIACNLEENNYTVVKPFKLNVLVSDFQMRSTSSALWLGAMAGADRLSAHASLQPEAGANYDFKSNTSTIKGGLLKPGQGQRINLLTKDLAARIVEEIVKQGYLRQ